MIRSGQQFKFTIDYGKQFLVSDRYPTQMDNFGNPSNVFTPKEIHRRDGKSFGAGRRPLQIKRRHLAQRRAEKQKISPFDYSRQVEKSSARSSNRQDLSKFGRSSELNKYLPKIESSPGNLKEPCQDPTKPEAKQASIDRTLLKFMDGHQQ